ncbi:hypothetical protein FHL15_008333 [Xylaria flabelliformis]|uniref:54S ribosomal protein L31, mitochondrial n=1 Tax=Xylaria flabelliformis TaxID=2512241 RepID=A0A553HS50_9PEZI|nr:hypothetical protein FHL15_008333 [Xylaria flabelliformis]
MFGAFRATNALSGGLLWKTPWRLSRFQKARHRERLRAVDAVVATVDQALAKKGETLKALDVWKETMPTEAEMLPKDKYTMFDRKEKRTTEMDESLTTIEPTGLLERLECIELELHSKMVSIKIGESLS